MLLISFWVFVLSSSIRRFNSFISLLCLISTSLFAFATSSRTSLRRATSGFSIRPSASLTSLSYFLFDIILTIFLLYFYNFYLHIRHLTPFYLLVKYSWYVDKLRPVL